MYLPLASCKGYFSDLVKPPLFRGVALSINIVYAPPIKMVRAGT